MLYMFRKPTNRKTENLKLEKKRIMKTEMDRYEDEDFVTVTKICNGNTWNKKEINRSGEREKLDTRIGIVY